MRSQRSAALVLACIAASATWLLALASWNAALQLPPASSSALYHAGATTAICALGALIAAWYTLSLALGVVGESARWRQRSYLAPGARRLVRMLAALLTAIAMPLGAANAAPSANGNAVIEVLPPLPSPPANQQAGSLPSPIPPGSALPEVTQVAKQAGTARASHVVQPGECLWQIARSYHPAASNGEIATIVKDISQRNPAITDPNLIYPGQVLTLKEDR